MYIFHKARLYLSYLNMSCFQWVTLYKQLNCYISNLNIEIGKTEYCGLYDGWWILYYIPFYVCFIRCIIEKIFSNKHLHCNWAQSIWFWKGVTSFCVWQWHCEVPPLMKEPVNKQLKPQQISEYAVLIKSPVPSSYLLKVILIIMKSRDFWISCNRKS